MRVLLALSTLFLAPCAAAQTAPGTIAQLFTYRLNDRPAFEAGYRKHLEWHAAQGDRIAWYAWYVTAGDRVGTFIDGTFGATLAELDARPDLPGDGADFARTAGPHAAPLAIDTWELWRDASTATPLEQRKPPATLDIFRIEVVPANGARFEEALLRLTRGDRPGNTVPIGWYRLLRGGAMPGYMVVVPRANWQGVAAGETLPHILARAYGVPLSEAQAMLAPIAAIRSETWSYAPRLALLPGEPLAP